VAWVAEPVAEVTINVEVTTSVDVANATLDELVAELVVPDWVELDWLMETPPIEGPWGVSLDVVIAAVDSKILNAVVF